jgi:hypothetical protein
MKSVVFGSAKQHLENIAKWILPYYKVDDKEFVNLGDANAIINYAKLALESLNTLKEESKG